MKQSFLQLGLTSGFNFVKADTNHTSFINGTLSLREENEVKNVFDYMFVDYIIESNE